MPKNAKSAGPSPTAAPGAVARSWSGTAERVYELGFARDLRRHPEGGVGLFPMELVQNDAPGAGRSEKGVCTDLVWGRNRARKVLTLADPRAEKAWLVLFVSDGAHGGVPRLRRQALRFRVNGHESRVEPWDAGTCHLPYRWVEFPAAWLKQGANVIDLYCPAAKSESEAWELLLARADEFRAGGGDPAHVGETSFRSADGGRTWRQSPFGPEGNTRAEYTVRLSLDRYVPTGWLATPVIDTWRGDASDFLVPPRMLQRLRLRLVSEVPAGTAVEYFLRCGPSPEPFAADWGGYEPIGAGVAADITQGAAAVGGRYVQVKAVLSTTDPLATPRVRAIRLDAELLEPSPAHESLVVTRCENPAIGYSSLDWEWESWDRPEFEELRARENLDGITAGSRTPVEAIVRLCEYATTRVARRHGNPLPEYPGWDALSILNRIDRHGTFGMCIQFNNFLNGTCMVYGWQARLVNIMNHEVAEVWSDDFGKWVYFDANYGNHHYVDARTGEPLSLLDLHRALLASFFPDRPIDWMHDLTSGQRLLELIEASPSPPAMRRSSPTHHYVGSLPYEGLQLASFLRVIPRNNFYEKPFPRPLAHGCTWWPWDGYVNWYDERTPPHRQYSRHTDRPQDLWPDLNRVRVHATSCFSNRYVHLRFETYTPNFSHLEVDENDSGWKRLESKDWTWVLAPGRNTLRARAVNRRGARGKPSVVELNRAEVPLEDVLYGPPPAPAAGP
jgi:hypothetical protein